MDVVMLCILSAISGAILWEGIRPRRTRGDILSQQDYERINRVLTDDG